MSRIEHSKEIFMEFSGGAGGGAGRSTKQPIDAFDRMVINGSFVWTALYGGGFWRVQDNNPAFRVEVVIDDRDPIPITQGLVIDTKGAKHFQLLVYGYSPTNTYYFSASLQRGETQYPGLTAVECGTKAALGQMPMTMQRNKAAIPILPLGDGGNVTEHGSGVAPGTNIFLLSEPGELHVHSVSVAQDCVGAPAGPFNFAILNGVDPIIHGSSPSYGAWHAEYSIPIPTDGSLFMDLFSPAPILVNWTINYFRN